MALLGAAVASTMACSRSCPKLPPDPHTSCSLPADVTCRWDNPYGDGAVYIFKCRDGKWRGVVGEPPPPPPCPVSEPKSGDTCDPRGWKAAWFCRYVDGAYQSSGDGCPDAGVVVVTSCDQMKWRLLERFECPDAGADGVGGADSRADDAPDG